jgi:hypothetical protein
MAVRIIKTRNTSEMPVFLDPNDHVIRSSQCQVKSDGTVTWIVKGKKRTGKLSPTGNVSHQVDTWTAQFTDETGKTRKISAKTTNRAVAEKLLVKYEKEVDRIRTGVLTREELEKAEAPPITLHRYGVSAFRNLTVSAVRISRKPAKSIRHFPSSIIGMPIFIGLMLIGSSAKCSKCLWMKRGIGSKPSANGHCMREGAIMLLLTIIS